MDDDDDDVEIRDVDVYDDNDYDNGVVVLKFVRWHLPDIWLPREMEVICKVLSGAASYLVCIYKPHL